MIKGRPRAVQAGPDGVAQTIVLLQDCKARADAKKFDANDLPPVDEVPPGAITGGRQ